MAVLGGALAISGVGGLTLGAIAAFLQLSKSFMMPISQVSQQLSSVVMALAGAERIFKLMDEPLEEDTGDVTLVNATYEGSALTEAPAYTGIWAWKEIAAGPSLKGVQAVLKSGIIGLKSVDMPDKPVTSKYGITRGPHYYQRNDD